MAPSLNLPFAETKQLDGRITFTRASNATYFDAAGVMQTAADGVARFNHNPANGESLGLLIEEARTNLLIYSEAFGNGAWTLSANVTVTPNDITSPYGDVTADRLTKTANAFAVRGQSSTGAVGPYTGSVFVKDGNLGKVSIDIFDGTPSVLVRGVYDFSLNTFTALIGSASAFASYVLPNGWVRISATATISIANPQIRVYPGNATEAVAGYVYIWGAQLEAGTFPTSYIKTEAIALTRAADIASMTGTNFSSWYNQSEGTFVAKYSSASPGTSGFDRVWNVDDGTNNNTIALLKQNGSGTYYSTIQEGGVAQAILSTAAITANTFVKTATGYKTNDVGQAHNGATVQTDTVATIPVVTKFGFCDHGSGVNGSHSIRSLTYYPQRLTNATLQVLSA
jgi:hypothetical protein